MKRSRGLPPAEVSERGCPEPLVPTHPLPQRLRPQIPSGESSTAPHRGLRPAAGSPKTESSGGSGGKGARSGGHASRRGPAREAGGGGARSTESTCAVDGFRLRPPGGTEGPRGAGCGRCGVTAAPQLPRIPPCPRSDPTPAPDRSTRPRPEGVLTARRSYARRDRGVRPRGHLAG